MSSAIYWLAIKAYSLALYIAAFFHPKAKLFVQGRKGLLKHIRYKLINERRPRIWMHCASLGEFEQGRPVLEKLRAQYPQYAFVLTFFSPSGYEVRKNYDGADYIFYLPLDNRYNARRFLRAVQPRVAIFVKYEFWYSYLMQLAKQNIPVILISAIFSKNQLFFKWYGSLHRRMLHVFSHIFVQNDASEQLLNKIGVEEVTIAGDTRFDRVLEAARSTKDIPMAAAFCKDHKILVAGSTWEDDERFLEKAFSQLPPHWKMIIVPHEVHHSHIQQIQQRFGEAAATWSAWRTYDNDKRILIVDTVGLLTQLYSYADVVWIGGGFGKAGIHNILEAAVYGIPVAFGPVYHRFAEAVEILKTPAAITASQPAQLVDFIAEMEKAPYSYTQACGAAEKFVAIHGGATRKIIDYFSLKNWLNVP